MIPNGLILCEKCGWNHLQTSSCIDQSSTTWPIVYEFAKAMEAKLAKNRHKGDRAGWLKQTPEWLVTCLYREVSELLFAIESRNPENVINEAADVANFAMMIADVMENRERT